MSSGSHRREPKNGRGKSNGKVSIRPYFTTRHGRKVWARDYGYAGWPIGKSSRR